ncbi:hypothetical protein [Ruminococcus sp.]|uniref:hypothetical protein n=1 Tax=Ruminococcus sp. TaxID=41978 RepID=UPI002E8060F1|nr:hypothetical protein [Ruminococcus sp.]MEE3491541.1 hypothetical protein [Ruminococcus sp.]
MNNYPDINELAIAAWRLEKWLDNLNCDRKMAAKSALRNIKKYITASKVEVIDPIGSKFDPGLAVDVVNNESEDADENELIIIETLSPYIYQNGNLNRRARVIIGTAIHSSGSNNVDTAEPEDISAEKIHEKEQMSPPAEPEAIYHQPADNTEQQNEVNISDGDIERMIKYAKIL